MTRTAPYVIWTSYGDSTLNFELRAYFRNYDDVFDTKSELHYAIFKEFEANNITIPSPQRDIHILSKEHNETFKTNEAANKIKIEVKKDAAKKPSVDKKAVVSTKETTTKKTKEDKKVTTDTKTATTKKPSEDKKEDKKK